MLYNYDVAPGEGEDSEEKRSINQEGEYLHAKSFLQKASTLTGDNLYDHLSEVLNKILAERPENIIDFFEEYSRKVKERRFNSQLDRLEDMYVPAGRHKLAQRIMSMIKPAVPEEPSTMDPADLELADMTQNNMLEMLYYFEQAGLGLPRYEMFMLTLSMKKLVYTEPIASIRFWGIIYGLRGNYYIVETDLKEEEYIKRNENIQEEEGAKIDEENEPENLEGEEDVFPPHPLVAMLAAEIPPMGGEDSKFPRAIPAEPKMIFEEEREPPAELSGVGVNKKVYYVCSQIGDTWSQLPDLTPKQIRVARQIYKTFTGSIEQEIVSYPEFPGVEREYLRAQIARISAGTQISPLGYYTFSAGEGGEGDEDEEEAEEAAGGVKTEYRINKKYDPPPIKDLTDGTMSYWVHHTQYILPQGRTTWWSASPVGGLDEADDEAMGEEEEDAEGGGKGKATVEPETGPPLLTPCSEDASLEAIPAWSVRSSSKILEEYAIVTVRSHLWPGAYCFTTQGKLFQNIYLGNGLKYMSTNFSPTPLPPVQLDYPSGPEIMEVADPTGAEEEEWRIAHLPKPKDTKGDEEEQEEEEEEEEEEDED